MGRLTRSGVRWLAQCVCLMVAGVLGAATIGVRTEPGGKIDTGAVSQWDGHYENVRGAFYWNGSRWVTNDTAAHTYFVDQHSGQRLKLHNLTEVDSSAAVVGPVPGVPPGYAVTKSLFSYTKTGTAPGTSYTYQAIEYVVVQPDGTTVILRSRGSGNGTAQAYLEAFIEDKAGNTSCVLGDPVLLLYTGTTAAQAVLRTPVFGSDEVRGNLPTCAPAAEAQYWMDINGGSEMGGASYHFHTQCLSPIRTTSWGAAFAVDFQIEFTDAAGKIQDIHFRPALASETVKGPPVRHLRRHLRRHVPS